MTTMLKPFTENDLSNARATEVETDPQNKMPLEQKPQEVPEQETLSSYLDYYDPFGFSRTFGRMFNEFEKGFVNPFNTKERSFINTLNDTDKFCGRFNVHEDDKAFTYEIEVPGIPKEEIVVEEKGGFLTISGQKRLKKEENKDGYHYIGTSYGSFKRSFKVPKNTDLSSISAKYDSGVLNLTIPKVQNPSPDNKRIPVS